MHSADSGSAHCASFCLLIAYLWNKRKYPTDKREESGEKSVVVGDEVRGHM